MYLSPSGPHSVSDIVEAADEAKGASRQSNVDTDLNADG